MKHLMMSLNPLSMAMVLGLVLSGCATRPASTSAEQPAPAVPIETSAPAPTKSAAPPTAPAPAPATKKYSKYPPKPPIICTHSVDGERVLEVAEKDTTCFLYYTKDKIKKRVAWSKNGNIHCEIIRDKMRVNLEKGGYTCRWQEG